MDRQHQNKIISNSFAEYINNKKESREQKCYLSLVGRTSDAGTDPDV